MEKPAADEKRGCQDKKPEPLRKLSIVAAEDFPRALEKSSGGTMERSSLPQRDVILRKILS